MQFLINGDSRLLSPEHMSVFEKASQPLKEFWPALNDPCLDTTGKKLEKIFEILKLPQQFTLDHLHASRVHAASEAGSYYYDSDEMYSGTSSFAEHQSHQREAALIDNLITTILFNVYPEISQIQVPDAKELVISKTQKVEISNITTTDFEISYKFKLGKENYITLDDQVKAHGLKIITSSSDFNRSFTKVGDNLKRTLKIERHSALSFT